MVWVPDFRFLVSGGATGTVMALLGSVDASCPYDSSTNVCNAVILIMMMMMTRVWVGIAES